MKKKVTLIAIAVLVTACKSTKNSESQSAYQKLDFAQIEALADNLNQESILVSNKEGIQLKTGAVLIFSSTDGNLGKMEIVSVNPGDNYKIAFNYTVYNNDGSVKFSKENFGLRGTWPFDLDKGTDEAIRSDKDIWNHRIDGNLTNLSTENDALIYLIPE